METLLDVLRNPEAITVILPFLIIAIVFAARLMGLDKKKCPYLVGLLAVVSGVVMRLFYSLDINIVINGVIAGFSSSGIYSFAKEFLTDTKLYEPPKKN